MPLDLLDVCNPETREDYAALKEGLMDIDSNFDDDYNSINALKKKSNKKVSETKSKKIENKIKSKKKVTFDCADENSSTENDFDHENMSDEEFEKENMSDDEIFDEECDDESMFDEDIFDEESALNGEGFGKNHEEEFDCSHEEEFDYSCDDEKQSSNDDLSDDELNENLLDSDDYNSKKKDINLQEDIYGRIKKPDGTIVVGL